MCNARHWACINIHSKIPHVVTVLWQDSDDVVTTFSPTRNLVEGYKNVIVEMRYVTFILKVE